MKKALISSTIVFLFLAILGFAIYGTRIPGNVHSLLKTGSYTKKLAGRDIFRGNESGHQYMVEGDLFTSTGADPYFVLDVSGEPHFAFVRVKISNLTGEARGEIHFLAEASEDSTKWMTTGRQELANGVNVFELPRDIDAQVLRFSLTETSGTSFNLKYIMLTNNWYVSPLATALILAAALVVTLMLGYLAGNVREIIDSLLNSEIQMPTEVLDRHILGLLGVHALTIPLAYATVMTAIKTNNYLNTERIEQLYNNFTWSRFCSEPHEFQRFALYCVLICVLSLGFTLFYRWYMGRISDRTVKLAVPALLGCTAMALALPLYPLATFDNKYYIKHLTLNRLFWTGGLFFLCCCAFLAYRILSRRFPRLRLAVFLFDTVTVGLVWHFSMLQCYYNLDNSFHKHHFSVIFNPIFELANNHTPGVDFNPLYGLHGYFFYYLQRIVWGDIYSRDTVVLMGALVFIGNIALYIFLVKTLRCRFVAAVTLLAIIYYSQIRTMLVMFNAYYAYLPIRTIVPMLTLCLIGFIHTTPNARIKRILFVCAALVATGGIFWNPESGLASVFSLAGYMAYCTLCEYRITARKFWKKIGLSLIVIVGSWGWWLLLLQLVTLNSSGAWYSLSSLFWSITAISGDGFNLMPLPESHPFVYVLWLYSAVVILSLYSLFVRKAKPNKEAYDNALGLATGLMGFGLFIYFLGRTQWNHFTMTIWPAFVTVAFIARKLYDYFMIKLAECKGNGWNRRKDVAGLVSGSIAGFASLALAFGIFATGFFLYYALDTFEMQVYSASHVVVVPAPTDYSIEVVDRFRTDRLFMVNEYSMFYLSELGLGNDYRGQAVIDCFFKQDYLDIVAQLESYEGRVFIAANIMPSDSDVFTFEEWGMLHGETVFSDGETFNEKLQRVFAERYVLVAEEGGWAVYDSK